MGFKLPKTKGMLRREAAGWLARLQSGREHDVELNFRRWHEADPRHAEAFDRVRRSYEQAGLLRQSRLAAIESSEALPSQRARAPRYAFAAAAAVLVLLVPAALIVGGGFTLGGTNAVMLATRVGEIRQVRLSDGSKVTLDTATRLEVEVGHSRRRARLEQGRARFEVASAGQPFVVETSNTIVTTGGGVVDVAQDGQQSRVDVLAGSASVGASRAEKVAQLTLGPGNGATASAAGALEKHGVAAGPDWTRGMLQFDGTPLGSAVAQANLYSERPILVEGNLDQLRVTGAFRAGDTTGLARALAAAFHLSLRQAKDGSLVLSRKDLAPSQKKNGG